MLGTLSPLGLASLGMCIFLPYQEELQRSVLFIETECNECFKSRLFVAACKEEYLAAVYFVLDKKGSIRDKFQGRYPLWG